MLPWHELTVEKTAEILAQELISCRELTRIKQAGGFGDQMREWGESAVTQAKDVGGKLKDWGGQAVDYLGQPQNHTLRAGLTGAGIGGLLGAISTLDRDKDDRNTAGSALTGAIAGGAIGAGGHALLNYTGSEPGKTNPKIEQINKTIDAQQQAENAANAPSTLRRAVGVGAAAGGVGAVYGVDNTPGTLLRRGARGVEKGDDLFDAVKALRNGDIPGSASSRAAWSALGRDAQSIGFDGVKEPLQTTAKMPWSKAWGNPTSPSRLAGLTRGNVRELMARSLRGGSSKMRLALAALLAAGGGLYASGVGSGNSGGSGQ